MHGILTGATTRTTLGVAVGVCAAMLLLVLGVLPDAARPLTRSPEFLAGVGVAVFLLEGMTAYFLVVHFAVFRSPVLGMLGAAYGFSAVCALAQLLTFPGVFAPAGLLAAPEQTSIWIWIVWHLGFPLFLIAAMGVQYRWQLVEIPDRHLGLAVFAAAAGPLLLAIVAAALIFEWEALLPAFIKDGKYPTLVASPVGQAVVVANVLAVATLLAVNRLKNGFFVWVTVSAFATMLEVTLGLQATSRYSLGWYASRTLGVGSAAVLLGALLWEINQLYPWLRIAYRSLHAAAVRDELTDLFNRRYFNGQLPARLAGHRRSDRPLSLIMADVDHFKRYNDEYGHLCGDRCLVAIAHIFTAHAHRPDDFAARYGGEELALVLPGTGGDEAAAVAERMREEVAQLRIATGRHDTPPVGVTISLGVATAEPRQGMNAEELVAAADAALYRAKEEGRDRVCVAPPVPAAEPPHPRRRSTDLALS